jgi:hypothetical protein
VRLVISSAKEPLRFSLISEEEKLEEEQTDYPVKTLFFLGAGQTLWRQSKWLVIKLGGWGVHNLVLGWINQESLEFFIYKRTCQDPESKPFDNMLVNFCFQFELTQR